MSPLVYAAALAALAVPPGGWTHNHNSPLKDGQPVVRQFERKPVDDYRRQSWECYTRSLDMAWQAYRSAGSTPEAFQQYLRYARHARKAYIYGDPYYVAFTQDGAAAVGGVDGACETEPCGP